MDPELRRRLAMALLRRRAGGIDPIRPVRVGPPEYDVSVGRAQLEPEYDVRVGRAQIEPTPEYDVRVGQARIEPEYDVRVGQAQIEPDEEERQRTLAAKRLALSKLM